MKSRAPFCIRHAAADTFAMVVFLLYLRDDYRDSDFWNDFPAISGIKNVVYSG